MNRADRILYDYYDVSYESHGREEASRRLKAVVVKGVSHLLSLPSSRHKGRARRVVELVRTGRGPVLVEEITATIRDEHKEQKEGLLTRVGMPDGVGLAFLPDVEVPRDESIAEAWRDFLARLDPRCRTGHDPATGLGNRIPFRGSVWLGDMLFRPGIEAAAPREIGSVRGNLSMLAAASRLSRTLAVDGNLYVSVSILKNSQPLVSRLGGNLHVFDRKRLDSPANLPVPPDVFRAWGLSVGRDVVLGDRRYAYALQRSGGDVVAELLETDTHGNAACRWQWNGRAWRRFQCELPSAVLAAVGGTLAKVRVKLGLPGTFLDEAPERSIEIIGRLVAFLDVAQGRVIPSGGAGLSEAEKGLFASLSASLAGLAGLLDMRGVKDVAGLEARAADVQAAVRSMSDGELAAAGGILKGRRPTVDLSSIRRDMSYLQRLLDDGLRLDDILPTAGRTLVFLNNVFRSPAAKNSVASAIAPARKLCAAVAGARDADRALLALLKQNGQAMTRLRRDHPDKAAILDRLASELAHLESGRPRDLVAGFLAKRYGTEAEGPELAADMAFLRRLQKLGGDSATLDMVFEVVDEGRVGYDLVRLRHLLGMNLESFIQNEVRRKGARLSGERPREAVRDLYVRLAYFEPVVQAYNEIVAGGGQGA